MWKELPSYKLAGKQGRPAITFPPFPGRPPDDKIFPVFFLQLRNNCCWHFLLQSLLFTYRSALAELIRVLKYAKEN